MDPIVLYRNPLSGHAHRVELYCSLLKLPVRLVDVNLRGGEQKKPEFLRKNPFGQVPVIEDGDVTIADSNAILVYLAGRYDKTGAWYPRDPVAAARVQQPYLTGETPTIADVAMYTYTVLAPEGELSLEPYGNIRAWLARIEALPGFVPMALSAPRT